MAAQITEQVYQDHPQIETIKTCLNLALEGTSGIPKYSLEIPGMSGVVYRKFINNYIRTLEDPRYLEIGTFQGSTLCSAIGGIDIYAIAVDNYSESYPHYTDTPEQNARTNIEFTKTENSHVQLLNQSFESFDPAKYGPFNVYMYDGWHAEEAQYQGIVRAVDALTDVSLVIVDDWNDSNEVQNGTYRGFEDGGLEVLYKIEVITGENPMFPSDWHNGYGIFLVKKKG